MWSNGFDLGIGGLELVLAGIVLAHLWRFRRGFPWLLVLTSFFVLRGVDRIAAGASLVLPGAVVALIDPLSVTVLVLLLLSIERIVRGLELAEDAARLREQEYARALLDYRRLARHRLATPLTAILGSIRFLKEIDPEDTSLREELLDVVEQGALRLERVSLDPASDLEADERSLRPMPSFESDRDEKPARHCPG